MNAAEMAELMRQAQRLCAQLEHREIDREDFLEHVTRLATAAVDCSRTGVWIFVDTSAGRILRCLGMYDGASDRMVEVRDEADDVEAYFRALEQTGCVVAPDVHDHPATRGFFARRLASRGVQSLLAVGFSANGKLYGAFTCTEIAGRIDWSAGQVLTLRRIAARASMALRNMDSVSGTTYLMPLGN